MVEPALDGIDAAVARDGPSQPETEHGWFESLLLAEGLTVFRADPRRKPNPSDRLLQVGEFPIGFAEPTLVAEVTDDSSEFQYGTRSGNPRLAIHYFRHGDELCAFPPIDTGTGLPLVGIAVTDTALGKLMGDELAEQLLNGLGLNPAPVAKVAAIPQHVALHLRALVGSDLDGSLMSLFAQAKALEYLCALAVHISARSRPRFMRKRDIVRRLHDDLAHRQGKMPTLGQLATECGISPKTLNEQFMRSYGLSIHSYMSTCQLRDAHTALLESSVPMKVLAERLGYSHVNNFIHAFSKRFGYSPGSLRRRRRADDAA